MIVFGEFDFTEKTVLNTGQLRFLIMACSLHITALAASRQMPIHTCVQVTLSNTQHIISQEAGRHVSTPQR